MGKNVSFPLDDRFDPAVNGRIGPDRRDSASDVVLDRPSTLVDDEDRLQALRAALIEGEESGISDRNTGEIWLAVWERHGLSGSQDQLDSRDGCTPGIAS